jgi:hypothetical protein
VTIALAGCAGEPASDGPAEPLCPTLPAGVSGSPRTIPATVAMVNALVQAGSAPLTIPCFLSRLERPMGVSAVNSEFSLQPGDGPRSPRMFAFLGELELILSVTPVGAAKDFLELAEYPTPLRSIKAEIAFPVTAPVPPAEPYERIRAGTGTVCGGCHRDERPAPSVTVATAFESGVFKPRPEDLVPLPSVREHQAACDPKVEPFRCAVFEALLGHGAVHEGQFPEDAPTIFD